MGALLPAKKVPKEIAKVRGYPDGYDIVSPAHYPYINLQEFSSHFADSSIFSRARSSGS
jgi:glutamate synthase domain-containing protein 2